MDQNHFWNLLAKKLAGETTPEEVSELELLIKTCPELSFAAQQVADLWNIPPIENKEKTEESFQKLLTRLSSSSSLQPIPLNNDMQEEIAPAKTVKKNLRLVFGLALAVIISIAGIFAWNRNEQPKSASGRQTAEIYSRPGTRTKMILPDSSVVWLNAGSKLTYSEPFGITERTVTLSGEAFFDVVKSTKPFIIHTSNVQIRVLGTAFNVRNYPNEKKVETSLVRGRVEITLANSPEKKYVLKPNEKLTLNTSEAIGKNTRIKEQEPLAIVSTVHFLDNNTIEETLWVENKLVFTDESFEEVAKKMERWYGVSIYFKNDKLKSERFTGFFEKETVWQALDALKLTVPFHFSVKDNEIIITH